MEKVPGTVSREKTCFCCEKEPKRSVQGKVERNLLSRTSTLLDPVGVPYKEAKYLGWSGTELEKKRGGDRARSQEGRRQSLRRLEVEDGLEILDNNEKTEQVPVKLSGILIYHQHQICSSSTSRSETCQPLAGLPLRAGLE